MTKVGAGRDELWRAVERELRRFAEAYERLPEWLWSPETVRLMQAVRPKLERLASAEQAWREFMESARPLGRRG